MIQFTRVIIVLALSFATHTVAAQDFLGEATYKSKRKIDMKFDKGNLSPEQEKKMMNALKKHYERTYILTFNKETSEYKEEESLGAPSPSSGALSLSAGDSDVLFKNIKENSYTQKKDLLGKIFLIVDSLPKHDWVLTKDTKNIGEYTCFKATKTITKENDEIKVTYLGDSKEKQEKQKTIDTITVTAWYTPQIPVSNGPELYGGLPGLIMELNDGTEVIACSKISMNMGKVGSFEAPSKGKKVSQAEYDKISDEKMQEIIKEGRTFHAVKDGRQIEIRIGG